MAEIELRKESFSMVRLDIFDRIKIKNVIEEYCGKNKITFKDLAKEMDISRAQLYNIFDSRIIDIQTLIGLQKKFNFCILKGSEVEKYLLSLEFDLFRIQQQAVLVNVFKSYGNESNRSEWLQNCHFLRVNSYYAFLYIRFISDFLWFDDRNYLKENHELLPFWQKKYLRNSSSIYRIPEYDKVRNLLAKDKIYKKSLSEEEFKYLNEKRDSLKSKKSTAIQDLLREENNFDWYLCRKISEFSENALISSSSIPNNNFGISFNFQEKDLDIESCKHYINIPIAGSKQKWMKYSAFVKTLILERKLNKNIENDHIKYHENFMKEVFELIKNDMKNIKIIENKLTKLSTSSDIRYINFFPSEFNYYSKDENIKKLLIDRIYLKEDNLDKEADLLLRISMLLYDNNWEVDTDCIGTELGNKSGNKLSNKLGNKVYYSDLIAYNKENTFNDEEEDKIVQIDIKIFKKKNTLQISTLERILKVLEKGGWDKHIIFSNLPFPEKCIEFVKRTNIYLLLDTELDKLMDTISN